MDFTKYVEDPVKRTELENLYKQEIETVKAKAIEPYADYDTLKATVADLQSKEKTANKQLSNLQKLNDGLTAELDNKTLDNEIDKAFFHKGIKDTDLFGSQIDKTKIAKNENGEFIGLEDEINRVTSKYSHLLQPSNPNPLQGATPPIQPPQGQELDPKSTIQKAKLDDWENYFTNMDNHY